ncbi:hypothetical protein EJ06DRAFT_580259 [Trichodelitschia bisporula]|uniref:Uncharacterized protein n=1 Tax=Trichodelitschia bisporula TaxID=703511 RepID=A0A6G1I4T8_9PEZI|nr:hypothetical protein EJ06DRAFT_580259 [Trichodelitschia bisporula]
MDDWGDPWAETAENTNIKRPPAISNDNVKPSIFGGFEDEAGWGDWETAAPGPWGESQSNTFGTEAREPSEASDTYLNEDTLATETTSPSLGDWQDPPTWNAVHLEEASLGQQLEGPHLGLGGHITEWDGNLRQHSTSEASTIVTNDTHAEILGHHAASDITFSHPVVEDGSSILSSIASSGVSVNYEKPQDSPRTSIDSGIHLKADEEITSSKKSFGVVHAERIIDGYLEKGGIAVPGHEIGNVVVDGEGSTPSSGSGNGLGIDVVIDREHKHAFNDTAVFQADLSLIDSLYPARKGPSTQQPPLDTLISTTSARKAWYRLTRGQTLREFNKGDADDNYIRVAWPDSAIRDFQFPLTRNGALSSENERAQTPKDADAPDVSSVQPGTGSTITQAPDDDEDEEWGDMVGASPTPEIISTPALVPQEVTSAPSSADADNISVQKRRPPDISQPQSRFRGGTSLPDLELSSLRSSSSHPGYYPANSPTATLRCKAQIFTFGDPYEPLEAVAQLEGKPFLKSSALPIIQNISFFISFSSGIRSDEAYRRY